MLGKQGGKKHERGRDAIGQAIEGRRFNRGRANGDSDLAIEEKQPNFDKHSHAKQNGCRDAYGRSSGVYDFVNGAFEKLKADQNNQHIDDKARHVFRSAVS